VKGRKNWAYHLARRVEKGDLPDWKWSKITAYDAVRAGVITDEEVAAAKRELPEAAFRELYLAEPSEDGANPFGLTHIAACVIPPSTEPPAVFGVDLAKSQDWTVVIGLDARGRVCVFERWQHAPWEATVSKILGLIGDFPALVDSTGVGDPIVETLRRRGGNVEGFKFTVTTRQQLMEGLALAIQQREVGFPEGLIRLELESFGYEQSRTGVRYAAPEGERDDCAVALALAVERARRHTPFYAVWTGRREVSLDDFEGDLVEYYRKKREDPEWGWGPSRLN
jgi:hypothetical protein